VCIQIGLFYNKTMSFTEILFCVVFDMTRKKWVADHR
jgi:hypothetical protein